jgi:zinc transport system substrate-binding protein
MKRILLLVLALISAVTLTACKGGIDDDKPVVYVTVYPVEFIVQQIAGDVLTVKYVPGASAHVTSVDWNAQEIIDMLNASLLFYVHAGADNYVPNNAELFAGGTVELVDLSQHLTYNLVCFGHDDTDCSETALSEDPHFWLDPVLMFEAAQFIKDKLIATFPEMSDNFNNNFTLLSSALDKLDDDYKQVAFTASKPIITTVKLFTYWQYEYGFDIYSITNDPHSTESHPGELIALYDFAIQNDIRYVLFEKNANSPAGEQFLEDLLTTNPDAEALYVHGLGKLTEDEYASGANYLSIMYDNLDALEKASK